MEFFVVLSSVLRGKGCDKI